MFVVIVEDQFHVGNSMNKNSTAEDFMNTINDSILTHVDSAIKRTIISTSKEKGL